MQFVNVSISMFLRFLDLSLSFFLETKKKKMTNENGLPPLHGLCPQMRGGEPFHVDHPRPAVNATQSGTFTFEVWNMFIEMSKRKIKSAFLDVEKKHNNSNKKQQEQQKRATGRTILSVHLFPHPESRLLLAKCEAAGALVGANNLSFTRRDGYDSECVRVCVCVCALPSVSGRVFGI